jgi:hypothetical protein
MSSESVAEASAIGGKYCHVCGADVSRKPRQKDDKGRYWCVPCAKAADAKKREVADARAGGKAQCPDCGKFFPPVAMTTFEETSVCDPCFQVRTHERAKAQQRREQAARGGEEERKQSTRLIVLVIIAAILAVFTTYWNFIR